MGSKANNWASYLRISRKTAEHKRAWEQVSIILLDKRWRVMPERRHECFLSLDLKCSAEDLRAFDLAFFSSIISLHLKRVKKKGWKHLLGRRLCNEFCTKWSIRNTCVVTASKSCSKQKFMLKWYGVLFNGNRSPVLILPAMDQETSFHVLHRLMN